MCQYPTVPRTAGRCQAASCGAATWRQTEDVSHKNTWQFVCNTFSASGPPSQGFSPPARCPAASAFSQLDNFFYSSETIMAARPHRQSGQDRSESGEESNKFIKQLAPLAPIFIACHFVWPAMTSQRSSAPQLHSSSARGCPGWPRMWATTPSDTWGSIGLWLKLVCWSALES